MKGEFCTVLKFFLAQQGPPPCAHTYIQWTHKLHHISLFETPGFDPWVGKIPWRRERLPTLQYSSLENSMVCIVHGVTKSQTRLSDFDFQSLWSSYIFFSFSKVFNTRKVLLLTLFYHILEFSVHLLFSSGLSLHLRLWNATYFSKGSLKGLLANPTPNNKNNKNKIPPPTIFPKPWSICLGNSYVIYYKIL